MEIMKLLKQYLTGISGETVYALNKWEFIGMFQKCNFSTTHEQDFASIFINTKTFSRCEIVQK